MLLHEDPFEDHPECPERLLGIMNWLSEKGILSRCMNSTRISNPYANVLFDPSIVHTANYLNYLQNLEGIFI